MKNKYLYLLYSIILFFITGCGKGIAPVAVEDSLQNAGFSGSITFKGNWQTDVTRTHLVVFKDPLNSPGDFNILNLKYVSLEIPFGVSSYSYSSLDSAYLPNVGHLEAGEYSYVAVVQSKTKELSLNRADWFVVGVYYSNNDTTKPGKLIIPENTLLKNINIICDFNNPPPQPPGGK